MLYLASQSSSRHALLEQAGIPFTVVASSFDERSVSYDGDVLAYVAHIAAEKCAHVDMAHITTDTYMLLAADTVIYSEKTNEIFEKPRDRAHAHQMLTAMGQSEITIYTAHAVRSSKSDQIAVHIASARATFRVPPSEIDRYLDATPEAFFACGAAVIEKFGVRYLENINGSLSATIGLDVPFVWKHLSQKTQ